MNFRRKFYRRLKDILADKNRLRLRVLGTVAAVGMALAPAFVAQASTVTKVGGENEFKDSATVANIYAMGQKGNVATNVFSDFKLDAGHIANLYFKTSKDSSTEAANLVNLVNNKIDIGGTVNAIKNNTIGGNLFFISPKGIAVGKDGVINAAAINMMTPSADAFEKMLNGTGLTTVKKEDAEDSEKESKAAEGGISGEFKLADKEDDIFIVKNIGEVQKMAVPVNPDGSIVVLGRLNAPDGVKLKAATVQIGGSVKTGEGEEAKEVKADKAGITTGEIDFTDLVNAGDAKAEISGDLKVKKSSDASGDIIIEAEAYKVNSINTYNDTFKQETEKKEDDKKTKSGEEDEKEKTKTPVKNNIKAEIIIAEGAKLTTAGNGEVAEGEELKTEGNIKLTATAGNNVPKYELFKKDEAEAASEEDSEKEKPKVDEDDYTAKLVGGRINRTEAIITVNGDLVADTIAINANAKNEYQVNTEDALKDLSTIKAIKETIGGEPLPFAVSEEKKEDDKKAKSGEEENKEADKAAESKILYYKLYSNAKVEIGEKGTLTANAKGADDKSAIDISAVSKVGLKNTFKDAEAYASLTDKAWEKLLLNAGVISIDTDNKATVEIKGKVKAEKEGASVSVLADADTNLKFGTLVGAFADKKEDEASAQAEDEEEKKDETKTESNNFAFVYADVDNAAEVILGKAPKTEKSEEGGEEKEEEIIPNEITADGDINIKANAKNTVDSRVGVLISKKDDKSDEPSAQAEDEDKKDDKNKVKLNTALNVVSADSSAVVNDYSKVTSVNKSVSMTAENAIDNHVLVHNGLDIEGLEFKAANLSVPTDKALSYTKGVITKGLDKLYKLDGYYVEGSSVAAITENNKAEVNVNKGAELKAKENLEVKADNTIIDNQVNVNTVIHKDKVEDKDSTVGAILYADYANKGKVLLGEAVKLEGKTVKIDANSNFDYGRGVGMYNATIADLKVFWDKYETQFKDAKDKLEALKDFGDLKDLTQLGDQENASVDGISNFSEKLDALIESIKLDDLDDDLKKAFDVLVDDAVAMGEIKNLANFSVGASKPAKDDSKKPDEGDKKKDEFEGIKGVSGTYNLINIDNNAKVLVGKQAEIKATGEDTEDDKAIAIKAHAQQHDLSITGYGKYVITYLDDKKANESIGGVATVHNADANSSVIVAEGAKIVAEKGSVDMVANSDVDIIAITFGGGPSSSGNKEEKDWMDRLDEKLETKGEGLEAVTEWVDKLKVIGEYADKSWEEIGESVLEFATKNENNGLVGMASYAAGKSNSIVSVDDEATVKAKNELNLKADNLTVVTNIVGDVTGKNIVGTGASYGEIGYKVNNIAAIADNDKDATRAEDDSVKNYNELVKGALEESEQALLGTKDETVEASHEAKSLDVKALTTGVLNNLTVAGMNEKTNVLEKSGTAQVGKTSWRLPSLGQKANGAVELHKGSEDSWTKYLFPVDLLDATSASVNDVEYTTAALVEGVKLENTNTVNVRAEDTSFLGAYSGAGALMKAQEKPEGAGDEETDNDAPGSSASVVGYTKNVSNVISQIKDSSFKETTSVSNVAEKAGVQLGLGVATAKNSNAEETKTKTVFNSNNSFLDSYNTVTAKMLKTEVVGKAGTKANVNNVAFSKDIQVAGGVTVDLVKNTDNSFGTAITYAVVDNKVNGVVEGGSYTNVKDMEVLAGTKLVQVGTAVSLGVSQGQSSTMSGYGALTINTINNEVQANVKDTIIKADNVDIQSFDGKLKNDTITDADDAKRMLKAGDLDGDGKLDLDLDGKDALADASADQKEIKTKTDADGNEVLFEEDSEDGSHKYEMEDYGADTHKGNVQVGTALSLSVDLSDSSKYGAAVASADNIFSNKYTSNLYNVDIEVANKLEANAEQDTVQVAVAAGSAASTAEGSILQASGSINVVKQNSDVNVIVANSKLTGKDTKITASNDSLMVNVAGQVSVGKGTVGLGISNADNLIDNNTGAYVFGSTIVSDELTVSAESAAHQVGIAAGVIVNTGDDSIASVAGNVAVNQVRNNTEAIVDALKDEDGEIMKTEEGKSYLTGKKINVNAINNAKLTAIAGNVNVATGGVAAAGAAASNVVGSSGKHQNTLAQINNTNIVSSASASDSGALNVTALDTSRSVGVAAGVVVDTSESMAAADGSVATSVLHKNNEASMNNVTLDAATMDLLVDANTKAKTFTSADAVVVNTGSIGAFGVGVAVTNSKADTKAIVDSSALENNTYEVKSASVKANSENNILNVGFGVSVASGSALASVASNVAVNNIGNDTYAGIIDTNIKSEKDVLVDATSKEKIQNYAGAVAVTAGSGYAAVGLSVAVNNIDGDTQAEIEDGDVEANAGNLTVNADAKHEISNVVGTVGVAAGDIGVSVAGTNSFNNIKGDTSATIINKSDKKLTANDIKVNAKDIADILSVDVIASVGVGGEGVGVGEASDSNEMSRDVTAQINHANITAKNLDVIATNKNKLKSNVAGVAVAVGDVAVTASATVATEDINGTTLASVKNTKAALDNNLKIAADHETDVLVTNNYVDVAVGAYGAAAGVGVTVVDDKSATIAELDSSTITHTTDNKAEDSITAHNKTKQLGEIAGLAAAITIGGGAAVNVNVDELDNEVHVKVKDSTIGTDGNRAKEVKLDASNDMDVKFYNVNAAAGIGAGAVGVGVINADSTVTTDILGSTLYANELNLNAIENRSFEQVGAQSTIAGLGIGASVMVIDVGNSVDSKYTYTQEFDGKEGKIVDTTELDLSDKFSDVDSVLQGQKDKMNSDKMGGVLGGDQTIKAEGITLDAGITAEDVRNEVTFDRAAPLEGKGVQVNVAGGVLSAGKGDININSEATTNVDQTVVGASVGVANIGVAVGKVDVTRKGGITITGDGSNRSKLSGQNVYLTTEQKGKAEQGVYQGAIGGVNLNAGISLIDTNGINDIRINNTDITSVEKIAVKAKDNYKADVEAVGASIGGFTGGAIVADAQNNSETKVFVESSSMKSNTIELDALKENSVKAMGASGALSLVEGSGTVAIAEDKGLSKVEIGEHNGFNAENIMLTSTNKPKAETEITKVSAGGVCVTGTVSKAIASGTAATVVKGNNTFDVRELEVNARTQDQEGTRAAKAYTTNVGVSAVSGSYSLAKAETNMKAIVDFDSSNTGYKIGSKLELVKPVYKNMDVVTQFNGEAYVPLQDEDGNYIQRTAETDKEYTLVAGYSHANIKVLDKIHSHYVAIPAIVTGLALNAENTTSSKTDAEGVAVAGFASSANFAENIAKGNTQITLKGNELDGTGARLDSIKINSITATEQKADADAVTVALATISPLAVKTETSSNVNSNVDISGKFYIEKDMSVEVTNLSKGNMHADATAISIAGVGGSGAYNSMSGTSAVNFKDADIYADGNLDVVVNNKVVLGDEHKYSVEGVSATILGGAGAVFLDNQVNKTAEVNVTDSTLLTKGSQTLAAYSNSDINSKGKIISAGIAVAGIADVNDKLTFNNTVNVTNSSLKTDSLEQDITLAASDNVNYNLGSYSTLYAGVGFSASAEADSKLNRNNSINLNEGADVYSKNNVNLYAGKDAAGNVSRLNRVNEVEVYNHAAIPVHNDPDLDYTMNQKNEVNIAQGAKSQSIYDTEIFADSGVEKVRNTVITYKWYDGDGSSDYASTNMGQVIPGSKHDNSVTVDGEVIAGVRNKQHLYIGKEAGQIVITDPDFREHTDTSSIDNYDIVGEPSIDASKEIIDDGLEFGHFNYSANMVERYREVRRLIAEYSDNKLSSAYAGYVAEAQRLEAQMKASGVMTEDGKILDDMQVDYVKLPDMIASGGDIILGTAAVNGSGTIEAKGSPEIDVVNETNLYMFVQNVNVGHAGGNVNYNDNSVTSIDSFGGTLIASPGEDGVVSIESRYNGPSTIKASFTAEETGAVVEQERALRADIEVNGFINAEYGRVSIFNENNDILIQGVDANSSAGISAAIIDLTAANGTISQGYSEGITDIGGSVIKQYDQQYNDIIDQLTKDYIEGDAIGVDQKLVAPGEQVVQNYIGTYLAGESIYINAEAINLNGNIQAGYTDYIADIDPTKDYGDITVQDRINTIKAEWEAAGSRTLSDGVVTSGIKYRIYGGGAVYKSGNYAYEIAAYYNPSNDTVVLGKVDAKGGQIYLTGRISNTGGGSVRVMDGTYDININNKTDFDLKVNDLLTKDVKGKINLTDTNYTYTNSKGEKAFYTLELTRDDDYNTVEVYKNLDGTPLTPAEIATISTEAIYKDGVYTPLAGQRYNWTSGFTNTVENVYEREKVYGFWWDWYKDSDTTDLIDHESHNVPIKVIPGDLNDKLVGEYIDKIDLSGYDYDPTKINQDTPFYVLFDRNITTNERTDPRLVAEWRSGFLNWYHHYKYEWTTKTGSVNQFVGSVKADNKFDLGFIGYKDGSEINIQTPKNLIIAGDVGNTKLYKSESGDTTYYDLKSLIHMTAENGSINQISGKVYGDDIVLTAGESINGIKLMTGDSTKLKAVSTNTDASKDVSINISTSIMPNAGGSVNIKDIGGAGVDEVNLKIDGNLMQIPDFDKSEPDSTKIEAQRINLTVNGAVGSASQDINVLVGQEPTSGNNPMSASLNIEAEANIHINETQGDLRLGTVASKHGDVIITVPGTIIDALPYDAEADRGGEEYLMQKWTELGLIGSAESEWTKDALLYAISESIINPESGQVYKTADKVPNISGHDIILNVGKGVGLNSDETTVIPVGQVGEIYNLKKLASVDASSVEWNAELLPGVDNKFDPSGEVVINDKLAIGIQNKENAAGEAGVVTINRLDSSSSGNVYLQNRNNGTDYEGQNMGLNKIDAGADGNVLLESLGSIFNRANDDSTALIKGNNLQMNAVTGSIGEEETPITVALNGELSATAGKGIINIDSPEADKNLVIRNISGGNEGDIVITAKGDIDSKAGSTGYIRSEGEGDIFLKSEAGSIGENSAIRIKNTEDDEEGSTEEPKHQPTVTAEAEKGNVKLVGITTSPDPAVAEGTLNIKNIIAKDDIDVAGNGNLVVQADVITTEGNIALKANGALTTEEDSTVWTLADGQKATLEANKTLTDNGVIFADEVVLDSKEANITQGEKGMIEAENLKASAQTGVELNNGQAISGGSDDRVYNKLNNVEINNAESGKVTLGNGGDNKLEVTVGDGKGGALKGEEIGIINYSQGKDADMSVTGAMESEGRVELNNIEGNLDVDGAIAAGADVAIKAQGSVETSKATDILANEDISVNAGEGHITLDGSETTKEGNVNISTSSEADSNTGAISINGAIHAIENGSVYVNAIKGDVNINDNILLGTYTKDEDGKIVINEDGMPVAAPNTGAGNLTIKTDEGDITSKAPASLQSLGGNVTAETELGEVDLYEILAQERASAGTLSGNLTLHNVNGNLVALYTKDMANNIQVDKAVVGEKLILAGNNIEMDDISQRPSGPDMLKVDLRSAKDDEPNHNVKLNFTKVNKGVEFLRLWVTEADIGLKDGMLYFDKLAVEKKAQLTNKDMKTTVYGQDPIKDGNDSIFWYDYDRHNPKDNLGSYFEDTDLNYGNNNPSSWYYPDNDGKWTYLNFEEKPHLQTSNGNLLHLTDYYYVYSQRFSEENLLGYMHDVNNPYKVKDNSISPDPAYFNRYDLYDLSDVPVSGDVNENGDKE